MISLCRHWGMRVVIPPGAVQQPTRVNCRYQVRENTEFPSWSCNLPPAGLEQAGIPSSLHGERGPGQQGRRDVPCRRQVRATQHYNWIIFNFSFRAPVLIEIPHFASTSHAERETVRCFCSWCFLKATSYTVLLFRLS